jgi:single-strand DNA-binding protein
MSSKNINVVVLTGNLGKAPVIKQGRSGVTYAYFNLATNLRYKDSQGEKHERTDWHRIVAFNGLAETLARLGKGDEVAVHGRLQSNTFEDREGKKRTVIEVVAETIQFLNLKNRDEVGEEDSPAGDAGEEFEESEDDDIPF